MSAKEKYMPVKLEKTMLELHEKIPFPFRHPCRVAIQVRSYFKITIIIILLLLLLLLCRE